MNIGKNISFGRDTRINFYDKENDKKLHIGDGSYFCNRVTILCGGKIVIGKNVLVASDVCFFAENHSIDANSSVPYMKQDLKFKDVYVGDGTWIGEKVIILPGTSVGKKCIIFLLFSSYLTALNYRLYSAQYMLSTNQITPLNHCTRIQYN